jgi:hypothetical protein
MYACTYYYYYYYYLHSAEVCSHLFNRFPHVHYSYAYALEHLELHTLRNRSTITAQCPICKFTLVLNSVHLLWKLLLRISETFQSLLFKQRLSS